ncbi:MAG TPA: TonB-dependent receptor [Prolixibacteraceae bacterium]|nr:TonB-dependent receptor [Prolixibacteraceae bacterium]
MKKKWLTGHPYGDSLKKLRRIMRLTILLLFGCMFTVSANSYAQKTKLDINMANSSIRDLFGYIEENSEFIFLYRNEDFNLSKKVEINLKDASINQILDEALKGENVSYDVYERQIVIRKASDAPNSQQQKKLSGTVKDSNGIPVPGVTVLIKGTTIGALTDTDGQFNLSVTGDAKTLVFSFVGMKTIEVGINETTQFNIVMEEETVGLDEVVAVGYGKSSRKNLSSAVTSVKADELNRGAISDIGQLLQGKVPGLNISASGDPTRSATIIMRGASTLNSSQSPFYVIDGVPGTDISLVAPDDIVSVDVLKDAAATSIYGNRAANGVIMITTKKGSKDKEQVSYNGYVGFENVSNQLDMMNSDQLRSFLTKNDMSFSPEDDQGANTNWQKEIQRPLAISNSHNLSYSGGSNHSNYIASITYIDKQGILLSSDQSRIIAHLAVEQMAFNDKVKFGINVTNSNVRNTKVPQRNTALLQAAKHLPVSIAKNADGTYFENFNHSGYFNPLAIIEQADDDSKYSTLLGNFTTEVTLPFGLTYNLNLAYQRNTSLNGTYYNSYYATNYNSAQFYDNPEPPATHSIINFGSNGLASRSTYQSTNVIFENYLTWNKELGKSTINAVVGYSWQDNTLGDGFQATNTNFPVDDVSYNNLALGNYSTVSGYKVNFGDANAYQRTRLISDFARVNYNYDSKYLLQASIRRDGSSVFGENKQWGYFPSVGVAWRIDQEGFMQSQSIFSDLKLRGSYGVTGNSSGFDAYTAQFIMGGLGTFYNNGQQVAAYGPSKAANQDLGWEKTSTSNLGLDFTVLKGKLSGYIEVYNKKTTGMIYSYSVNPVLVPAGYITANGGEMSNKGIEISLNVTPVKTKDFTWSSNINLAHNKNVIEKLTNKLFVGGDSVRITQPDGGGQTGSSLQILKEGKPIGQFFTLEYAGKNADGVSQYVAADGSLTTNPAIGTDYHYLGSPQPKVLLGWSNDFKYKNFDLNIFIRGVFGNKIFNASRADLFRPSTANSTNILVDAGNESANDLNSYKYSSRFIEDGSYIRLDNATLGYNFQNLGNYVKNLRIYSSVSNLFVITKYSGIDPEVEQGGIAPGVDSNNFYPKTRTVLFGVKATF